jgi:hypothetical protein
MQVDEIVEAVRNHYVPQLSDFIKLQRRELGRGAGEVKFNWGSGSRYYRDFVCIDFAAGGEEPRYVEFGLKTWLTFPPMTVNIAKSLTLQIESMRWDDVRLEHDAKSIDDVRLNQWFEFWFDPDDKRYIEGAELGDIIHRMTVEPAALEIDFGSSRSDAFWGLVDVLRFSGASRIQVSVPDQD